MHETAWRGLQVRLVGLVLALLVAQAALIAWYALDSAGGWFAEEARKKASAVARTVQQPFHKALDLEIGLTDLRGVQSYFDGVLNDNRDIIYLALSDAGGRVLKSSGRTPDAKEIAAATAALLQGGTDELARPLSAGEYLDTGLRLKRHNDTVGVLHVGSDPQYALRELGRLYIDVALLVSAVAVIALELIMAAYRRSVRQRLVSLLAMLHRVVGNDFGLATNLRGGDPIARLAQRVANPLRRVNAAYYFFSGWAEEVKASQIDDGVKHRIGDIIGQVRGRFAYEPVRSVPADHRHEPGDVRTTLFFLLLGEAMMLPLLPAVLADAVAPSARFWPALIVAATPLGAGLGLLLAVPLGRRLAAGTVLRAAPLGAALALAAAALWPDEFILLAMRAVAGVAVGLVAALALVHDAHWPPRAPFHALGQALGAGLTAMLVGPPLIALLSEELPAMSCLAAPAVAAALACLCALAYGGNAGVPLEVAWGGLRSGGRAALLGPGLGGVLPCALAFGALAMLGLPNLLIDDAGGLPAAGRLLGVAAAVALPASLLLTLLPGARVPAAGQAVAAACLLAAALLQGPLQYWLPLPAIGIAGALAWLVLPARASAEAADDAPDQRARGLLLLGAAGATAGVLLGGLLTASLPTLLAAAGVVLLLGAGLSAALASGR